MQKVVGCRTVSDRLCSVLLLYLLVCPCTQNTTITCWIRHDALSMFGNPNFGFRIEVRFESEEITKLAIKVALRSSKTKISNPLLQQIFKRQMSSNYEPHRGLLRAIRPFSIRQAKIQIMISFKLEAILGEVQKFSKLKKTRQVSYLFLSIELILKSSANR